MKRIKFPLIMKNGAEVRDLEELKENFNLESVAEYFSNGKLEKWLENNYYDDILEDIRQLDSEAEDFAKQLSEAFGVEWKGEDAKDLKRLMRQTHLKEKLKPYFSEDELEGMEYIADTQEELEAFVKQGKSPVYLYGETFTIRKWMEHMECIGIQEPTVELEITDAAKYKEKEIRLSKVAFADKEMKKLIQEPELGTYYQFLDALKEYLEQAEKKLK